MAILDIKKFPKKWKRRVNNKLRGAYGQTDFEKRVIEVNKKAHKDKKRARITPNKDGTESLIHTIVHEENHRKHPKKHERTVRREEKPMVKKLSKKQKKKLYDKYRTRRRKK